MTSLSPTTPSIFDRPQLFGNQTRLILSAHTQSKQLFRSTTHSAGVPTVLNNLPSARTTPISQPKDDDDLSDEHEEDNTIQQTSVLSNDAHYYTDIEEEEEPPADHSCTGIYLDQCHRHGVIPSTHFLRHIDNETLAIRYCGLKPINIKVMIPSLKINANITILDLRDNGLGSHGAVHIAELLEDNERIIELNLSDNDIGLQGCKALCQVLRLNRTIRRLHLDGNRFNDDCAPYFAEVFSQNDYIKYVNLSKNAFENEKTGRLLGNSLAENETIEEYYLAWNRLRAKSCGYFIKPLVSNARLTILDLSWNGASLYAAKMIYELLRKNSSLEKLYLEYNRFDTECATYIGKGLANNETLKVLTLNGNPLESSGCYAILQPLIKHRTSSLQMIDLCGINVNKDVIDIVKEFPTILPQLTVKLGKDRRKENKL